MWRRVAALGRLVDGGRSFPRHAGVNADQLGCFLDAHRLRDGRAAVAALRYEPGVLPWRFWPATLRAGIT